MVSKTYKVWDIKHLDFKLLDPVNSIELGRQVIKIRDSVSKTFVPGRIDETYMITEKAYLPVLKEPLLKGLNHLRPEELWEVQGRFYGRSTFRNYLVKDSINNRTLGT